MVTVISNGAYTGSIDASSSGSIPVTSLWRDATGARNCGLTSGVSLKSGASTWIPDPAPATDADGTAYNQFYSLKLGFAGTGTTTFTLTYSATQ